MRLYMYKATISRLDQFVHPFVVLCLHLCYIELRLEKLTFDSGDNTEKLVTRLQDYYIEHDECFIWCRFNS